ncbi:hypothetical protein OC834_003923 [Tilletia horrida]|uniref:DUF952 domain-containing protein n=1 Tax=Tilletia horrida TaxID=155126 RepID=A0AAN6JKI6_9BASI|nr:hypothetical protein OC835_005047 [Tilletia horrida]KAK0528811.1 hypothetical protein OC834_003923 [Tilletia horrida]KAK0532327.1 hypothetical protein OC842_003328 [Tilletia horrida]
MADDISYPDPRSSTVLYKILTPAEADALPTGPDAVWAGSQLDQSDGFLHTSSVHQLPITLGRFFSSESQVGDTVHIYALPRDRLEEGKLRWDVIKSGETFGHVLGCGINPSTHFSFHRTYHRNPSTGLFELDADLPF